MKTIVERAYDYADEKWGDIDEYHADTVAVSAYIAGAEAQKRIDIDKVCDWMDRYLHLFVMKGHINHSALEQEFRKAMEE